ncbi:MAG TPA: M81 family metallopeptidase [Candidatus Dormibacteraeota bacterium]|nr:M81 family metallopeptidase [Candidatus Dormibacteraeota bacterium]
MSRTPDRRIGIGGIAIESSTFSPLVSTLADFHVLRGEEMAPQYPFLPGWRLANHPELDWVPCLRARSLPGGPVASADYLRMKEELLERVRASLPLDGFYLHIHGAMSVLGMDDAEGDLATDLRRVVGEGCLISAGMDLHGNVSPRLVEQVDLFTAYRLAPHEDAPQTSERACRNLAACLEQGIRPHRAWARIPVILPGERTSTRIDPARTIYGRLPEADAVPGVIDASLWVGYVWADEPRSSATVVVTGTDDAAIRREAATIARRYWDARRDFRFGTSAGDADWCIAEGLARGHDAVIISDSGDNPTAGGAGDMTFMTARLLAHPALAAGERTALHASVVAPEAVEACRAAGVGGSASVTAGGVLDPVHGSPIELTGEVTALVEDPVGGWIAVLRSGGVHVVLTSGRKPYHHVRDFTALGWDIAANPLTVVKIGYLEPELRDAARHALLALTPGAVNQDIPNLHYERVERPIFPLDEDMADPDLEVRLFGS